MSKFCLFFSFVIFLGVSSFAHSELLKNKYAKEKSQKQIFNGDVGSRGDHDYRVTEAIRGVTD